MLVTYDPQWTRKARLGRITDPLQLRTVRNRILTDLLFGILSILVTQRNRYYSFYSWCFDHLKDESPKKIVLLEKIFLLGNLSHEFSEADKDYRGLVGATRYTESGERIQNLYKPSAQEYSLASDHFKIHENDGCGFFQYYEGGMQRLLLLNNRVPTPLGRALGKAFGNEVGMKFSLFEKACDNELVSRELIENFGEKASYRLLHDNKTSEEQALLRKIFFDLVDYSSLKYEDLKFVSLDEIKSSFDLTHYLMPSVDVLALLDIEEKLFETERYLRRYLEGGFGRKMRASLILFIHLIKRINDAIETKEGNIFEVYTKRELEIFRDIKELWKLFVFHEYLMLTCEATLFGILKVLESEDRGLKTEPLLNRITTTQAFYNSIRSLLQGFKIGGRKGAIRDFQDIVLDALYYEETVLRIPELNVSSETGTQISLEDALNTIEVINNHKLLALDSIINERFVSKFLLDTVETPTPDALFLASKLFACSSILLCLLKTRHNRYYTQNPYRKYWKWLSAVEGEYLGSTKIIEFLNQQDPKMDCGDLMKRFSIRFVINQHNKALFERISGSRVPWFFSQDFDGTLHFQNLWTPGFQRITKFERMIDIFYDLGFTKELDYKSPKLSIEGRAWLDSFISNIG